MSNHTRTGRKRVPAFTLIVVAILLLPLMNGCIKMLRGLAGDDSGLVYSHESHMKYTPECTTCHKLNGEEISRAGHKECVSCHAMDESRNDEKCLLCHTGTAGRIDPVKRIARSDYSIAHPEHAAHAEKKIDCRECHGDVTRAGRLSSIDFIRMEGCIDCHYPGKAAGDLKSECSFCHIRMDKDRKPRTHVGGGWTVMHGNRSRVEPFLCWRCHEQHYCDQCHGAAPPGDHTSVFKLRGHGLIAVSNPNRCRTCHTQDFCIGCHTSVQPKYHTRTFKTARPYTHCGMCHIPLDEGNRCRACHFVLKHDRARAEAPPAPPFVNRSQPCLQCHPVALVPIKHLYNTVPDTQCTQCHE